MVTQVQPSASHHHHSTCIPAAENALGRLRESSFGAVSVAVFPEGARCRFFGARRIAATPWMQLKTIQHLQLPARDLFWMLDRAPVQPARVTCNIGAL